MDLHLAARADDVTPPDAARLCWTWEAFEAGRARGEAAQDWESEFPAPRGADCIGRSVALSALWHRDAAGDLTECSGVSIGSVYSWLHWALALQPALKLAAALDAAAARRGARRLICGADVPAHAVAVMEAVARKHDAVFERRGAASDAGGSIAWRPPAYDLPAWRRLLHDALNVLSRPRRNGGAPVVSGYYHNAGPLVGALADAGLDVVWAEPPDRSRWGALLKGGRVFTDHRAPAAPSAEQSAEVEAARRRWAAARVSPELEAAFAWDGVSIWPALRPGLDAFFAHDLPELAWWASRLSALWNEAAPAALLLPYDGMPLPRLLQRLAAKHGTPSAVLLHGLLTRHSYTLEHRDADEFWVWGSEQERLLAAVPGGPAVVRAVGNPHFDQYARGGFPKPDPRGRRALLLTHPMDRVWPASSALDSERYVLEAVSALEDAGWRVTVKLHPSESQEHYRRVLRGRRADVRRGGAIASHLETSDLVVGSTSTAMIEALLLERPVIAFNPTAEEPAAPFDGRWGVPLARDGASLRAALQAAQDYPAFAAAAAAARPRLLSAFAGPVDGSAARRVAAQVARLTGRPAAKC